MAKIQIKRGLQSSVDSFALDEGELAVALDTGNVYIGTANGVVHLNPEPEEVPKKVSQLENDSNYQTLTQVNALISALVDSAPDTLDTLRELAEALGNDPNFAITMKNVLDGKEALIKNADTKTSIADNDTLPISDSVDLEKTKKITFNVLKSALKLYFDNLYNMYVHPSYTEEASGFYKVKVDQTGHVSAVSNVEKVDITELGIPGQDTTYGEATTAVSGLMSSADKEKLDGIESKANNYILPVASESVLGGIKIGEGLDILDGIVSVGNVDGGTF